MMTRDVANWTYDVTSDAAGRVIDHNPRSNWTKGVLYRAAMPAVALPPFHQAHDPSNPNTWTGRGR